MQIKIQFFSYFKNLTGCSEAGEEMPPGATLEDLHQRLVGRFPKLAPMGGATLIAVGVEYQPPTYQLRDGDEVSLFPPAQGG